MSDPVVVKPGWKTTEFWLATFASIMGAVVASGIVPETGPYSQVVGIIVTVLASLGYSVSRANVKANQ